MPLWLCGFHLALYCVAIQGVWLIQAADSGVGSLAKLI